VPTSRECAQCGKPELTVLRVQVDALEQDKRDLIGVIAGLQDIIAKLKHGLKGDYDLDMWLDWVMDKKAMQERISALEKVAEAADLLLRDIYAPMKGKQSRGWLTARENQVWYALKAAGYLGEGNE